jgi:hypothetical protein
VVALLRGCRRLSSLCVVRLQMIMMVNMVEVVVNGEKQGR